MMPATSFMALPILLIPVPTETAKSEPKVFPRLVMWFPREDRLSANCPVAAPISDTPWRTVSVIPSMALPVRFFRLSHREESLPSVPDSPFTRRLPMLPAALARLSRMPEVILANAFSTCSSSFPTGSVMLVLMEPASSDTAPVTSFWFFVMPFARSSIKSGI